MKSSIVPVFCILLGGCAGVDDGGVDELDSWDGKARSWVVTQLGTPDSRVMIRANVPDYGTGRTVATKVQKMSPGYTGQVERLHWQKKDYYYDVYLILVGKKWVVAEAVKWHKDVQF